MASISSIQRSAPAVATGSTSLSAATGNVAVTGVGFKPSWIACYGLHKETAASVINASGVYDGSTYDSSAQTVLDSTGIIIFLNAASSTRLYDAYDEGGNLVRGTIASFDDDGFTISKDLAQFAAEIFWIVGR